MTSRRDLMKGAVAALTGPVSRDIGWTGRCQDLSSLLGSPDIFNVRAFGATGNGTADDTAAIQKTIDSAHDAGGGLVFIPAGTYRVTSPVVLRSQVSVIGVGRASALVTNDVRINLVAGTGVMDIAVERLRLVGGGKDQTDDAADGGSGVQLQAVSRVRIVGCWLERFDDAILAADSNYLSVEANCITAIAGAGIRWLNVTLSGIVNNEMDGTRGFGNKHSAVNFVWLSATGAGFSNRCVVVGNRGSNFSYEGILVIGHHNLVSDNVIDTALNGVNCQSGSTERAQPVQGGSYNTVSGNLFRNTKAQGMRVGNSSGNNTTSGHDNLFDGNRCEAGSIGLDLAEDAYNNVSRGDSFTGMSSHGIGLGPQASWNQIVDPTVMSAGGHGILIQGGVGNSVSGGIIRLAVQDGIRVSGSPENTRIAGVTVVDADARSSGSYGGVVILGGRAAYVAHNRCFVTNVGAYQMRGLLVSQDARESVILGNDVRRNRSPLGGLQVSDPSAVVSENLDGSPKKP